MPARRKLPKEMSARMQAIVRRAERREEKRVQGLVSETAKQITSASGLTGLAEVNFVELFADDEQAA